MQLVADTYGHLKQSIVDQTLKETGSALFTKMDHKPWLARSRKFMGRFRTCVINGGRCRDRTCDPTRVKGVLYR
jgi:hypothetical protein